MLGCPLFERLSHPLSAWTRLLSCLSGDGQRRGFSLLAAVSSAPTSVYVGVRLSPRFQVAPSGKCSDVELLGCTDLRSGFESLCAVFRSGCSPYLPTSGAQELREPTRWPEQSRGPGFGGWRQGPAVVGTGPASQLWRSRGRGEAVSPGREWRWAGMGARGCRRRQSGAAESSGQVQLERMEGRGGRRETAGLAPAPVSPVILFDLFILGSRGSVDSGAS